MIDKKQFIEDLIANVKAKILAKSDRIPEEWDGVELRQYIADCFSEVVIKNMLSGKRKKDYRNTVYINNL